MKRTKPIKKYVPKIIAIDPGDVQSAYVILEDYKILEFDKLDNIALLKKLDSLIMRDDYLPVMEMVASYGMAVGKTVFDTCVWIGRFIQFFEDRTEPLPELIFRQEVKMNLCHNITAKDSNIIMACVDRFGNVHEHGKYGKGTKKNPGFFFGFSKDVWQAFALGVTYSDRLKAL